MENKKLHEIGDTNLSTLLKRANELGIHKEDIVQIIVSSKGEYKMIYESL